MDNEDKLNLCYKVESDWHLLWFSAVEFCKGYEYAEVVHGKREASNYPRM